MATLYSIHSEHVGDPVGQTLSTPEADSFLARLIREGVSVEPRWFNAPNGDPVAVFFTVRTDGAVTEVLEFA